MKIFPAIDLKDKKVVRLFQGDYDQMTVYSQSPIEAAASFRAAGADCLHMVDLDGAKDGTIANFEVIRQVTEGTDLFVQVGGGIRTPERISMYLQLGISRVILGTAAALDFGFAKEMAAEFGEKIAVGVDVKDGFVAINGWKELTQRKGMEFCEQLAAAGVKTVIYTDISRDGSMSGTNMKAYKRLAEIEELQIVASGGISFEEEILELAKMGTYGAILGKALYSGTLSLERAIKLAEE